MQIHRTLPHDTIFKIARQYSVQPTKILEDNGLSSDRLATGEELLILTPTRTVTVRGGESLSSIGRRFGVKKSTLIANNPALRGSEILRPGHILSVKFDTPPLGVASAVGIYGKNATMSKLRNAMPYLTYVIFNGYSLTRGKLTKRLEITGLSEAVKAESKIPLLGFCDKGDGEFLCGNLKEEICSAMVALAKAGNYSGISLNLSPEVKEKAELYEDFLLSLKKHLYGNDLILFCQGKSDTGSSIYDIADGVVLYTDKENRLCPADTENLESSKAFLFVSTSADFGGKRGSVTEAKRIAKGRGIEIMRTEPPEFCTFEYTKYVNGTGVPCTVRYPSLESIYRFFGNGAAQGFLGFAFDISRVKTPVLSLFNASFARADYSLL